MISRMPTLRRGLSYLRVWASNSPGSGKWGLRHFYLPRRRLLILAKQKQRTIRLQQQPVPTNISGK